MSQPALVQALESAVSILSHCDVTTGVCCCGDDMESHGNPMSCGHMPVDHGSYTAMGWLEDTCKLLAPYRENTAPPFLRSGSMPIPEDVAAIIAMFNDNCTTMHLTKTDTGWLCAEDGYEMDLTGMSYWIEAPSFRDWEPAFIQATGD